MNKPIVSAGANATPFQRFEALTRRILTTPKAELVKPSPKAASKSVKRGKKKG